MGRKVNFAEQPKKGPGKKTKKQPAPKFSAKLMAKGKIFYKIISITFLQSFNLVDLHFRQIR